MAKYCDKTLNPIKEGAWRDLRMDYDYTYLQEYENENLLAQVIWTGKVDELAHEMFWTPFTVDISYKSNGHWVLSPSDTKQFTYEHEALGYYHEYLDTNTDCYLDVEEGSFTESGNLASARIAKQKAEHQAKREAEEQRKAEVMKAAMAKREIEKEKMRKLAADKKALEELMAAKAEQERIAKRGDSYGSW